MSRDVVKTLDWQDQGQDHSSQYQDRHWQDQDRDQDHCWQDQDRHFKPKINLFIPYVKRKRVLLPLDAAMLARS